MLSNHQTASEKRASLAWNGPCQALIVDMSNLVCRYWHKYKDRENDTVRYCIGNVCDHIKRFNPNVVIIACEGGHDARRAILPSYKTHRHDKDEGLVEQLQLFIKAAQAIGWPCPKSKGHEADDVIALISKSYATRGMHVVICTTDKDLKRLIEHENISVCDHDGTMTTKEDVLSKYGVLPHQMGDYLSLMGDAADGIPGVKKIGQQKAAALIHKYGSLESIKQAASKPNNDSLLSIVAKDLNGLDVSEKLVQFIPCSPECSRWGKSKTWPQWPVENFDLELTSMKLSSLVTRIKDARK